MQTIDVLAHPWLQIMLKQVEIGNSTFTGRIACQNINRLHKTLFLPPLQNMPICVFFVTRSPTLMYVPWDSKYLQIPNVTFP